MVGDDELLVDEDSEEEPLTLSLKDAVIQLEDVWDSVDDTLEVTEGDTDELLETELIAVIEEEPHAL